MLTLCFPLALQLSLCERQLPRETVAMCRGADVGHGVHITKTKKKPLFCIEFKDPGPCRQETTVEKILITLK